MNNQITDTVKSLKSHPFLTLVKRFSKNVDTDNMPNWEIVWKAYHFNNAMRCKDIKEFNLIVKGE